MIPANGGLRIFVICIYGYIYVRLFPLNAALKRSRRWGQSVRKERILYTCCWCEIFKYYYPFLTSYVQVKCANKCIFSNNVHTMYLLYVHILVNKVAFKLAMSWSMRVHAYDFSSKYFLKNRQIKRLIVPMPCFDAGEGQTFQCFLLRHIHRCRGGWTSSETEVYELNLQAHGISYSL